jgi:hypothetical protein
LRLSDRIQRNEIRRPALALNDFSQFAYSAGNIGTFFSGPGQSLHGLPLNFLVDAPPQTFQRSPGPLPGLRLWAACKKLFIGEAYRLTRNYVLDLAIWALIMRLILI